MIFTLSLSPNYVSHWGKWEAIREILQNAYDQKDISDCQVIIEHEDDSLVVETTSGSLVPKMLLLGETDKHDLRGQYGEGFKLALLVLNRMGYKVNIRTGNQLWQTKIEHDSEYNSEVLRVHVKESDIIKSGVAFYINGLKEDDWREMQKNLCLYKGEDEILEDVSEHGRVYVGGLFVAAVEGFKFGYSFKPTTIKLNRDRNMVGTFELSYETSKLWAEREGETLYGLLKEKAPDVEYLENRTTKTSPAVLSAYSQYYSHYGDSMPVSTQEEITKAAAAGVKWVLVPESLKKILQKIKYWFIPSSKPVVERLKDILKREMYNLSAESKAELEDIIKNMEPKLEEVGI